MEAKGEEVEQFVCKNGKEGSSSELAAIVVSLL